MRKVFDVIDDMVDDIVKHCVNWVRLADVPPIQNVGNMVTIGFFC